MISNSKSYKSKVGENKLYELRGFSPAIVDKAYLKELKVKVRPLEETLHEMKKGSSLFIKKYKNKALVAEPSWDFKKISFEEPLKTHRYTSRCPVDILDVDPMVGCSVNCLYCLATDGDHSARKIVYENFGAYLRQKLNDENEMAHYYYYAPKTEPFQEPTLKTGVAHDILREFVAYFKKNPKSKSKLFILSKAGKDELGYKNKGESVLNLMEELSSHLIYDISLSIMPDELYPIFEPRASSNDSRLEAAVICRENNIDVNWAVVQPILLPFLTDKAIDNLLKKIKKTKIKGIKPEFLTLSVRNLSWLGQFIGYYDKSMEKTFYESYIAPENINNVKHRHRVAPDRMDARRSLLKLKDFTDKYGLGMNICHWVRSELNITPSEVPLDLRENLLSAQAERIPHCKPVGSYKTKT